jgi:hypothetical protein
VVRVYAESTSRERADALLAAGMDLLAGEPGVVTGESFVAAAVDRSSEPGGLRRHE